MRQWRQWNGAMGSEVHCLIHTLPHCPIALGYARCSTFKRLVAAGVVALACWRWAIGHRGDCGTGGGTAGAASDASRSRHTSRRSRAWTRGWPGPRPWSARRRGGWLRPQPGLRHGSAAVTGRPQSRRRPDFLEDQRLSRRTVDPGVERRARRDCDDARTAFVRDRERRRDECRSVGEVQAGDLEQRER